MLRPWLILAIFLLSSCASYSPNDDKEWINEYVDTGQFTRENILADGLVYRGSTSEAYSNIDHQMVVSLDDALLDLLEEKYGQETIASIGQSETAERFGLSYTILRNKIFTEQSTSDSQVCFETGRDMAIKITVIDTDSQAMTWGGIIEKQLSDTNCNSRTESENGHFVGYLIESMIGAVVDGIFDSAFGTYPEPPEVEIVARMIFHGFYEHLP